MQRWPECEYRCVQAGAQAATAAALASFDDEQPTEQELALLNACTAGDVETVLALIAAGVDVKVQPHCACHLAVLWLHA